MEITLEQVAEELLKIHSEETLNMFAEHFPKCFEYEIKIAKRLLNKEPQNNIVEVASP